MLDRTENRLEPRWRACVSMLGVLMASGKKPNAERYSRVCRTDATPAEVNPYRARAEV